jgi:hypothetical protein
MDDVYKAKSAELSDYLAAFKSMSDQEGLLVLINGAVVGMDVVSLDRAYQVLHPTLLKRYAMEALIEQTQQTADQVREMATGFFEEAGKCAASKYASIGYGVDYRFEGGKVAGSALVSDGNVIHLALYCC